MFKSVDELEIALATPSPSLIDSVSRRRGDLCIVGAGGKMGPSLALLARNAFDAAGRTGDKVLAVSRWSDAGAAHALHESGVTVISRDLIADCDLSALPDAQSVVYMVGAKFGTSHSPCNAWSTNVALTDRVAQRYKSSDIVALSTGNVYPFVSPSTGGATEDLPPSPVGDYAMSCLGRERILEYHSLTNKTRIAIGRLNYALDLRYGVLADIGGAVLRGEPVDLSAGCVNVVWQGYANEVVLRLFDYVSSNGFVINITGPEILAVRSIATSFGHEFGVPVEWSGREPAEAFLSNASRCHELFGYPDVPVGRMISWQSRWLSEGLPLLGKPTKYAVRDGRF